MAERIYGDTAGCYIAPAWTATRPTEPGWYWWKAKRCKPLLVRLSHITGCFGVPVSYEMPGEPLPTFRPGWPSSEWAGPVLPPE